LDILPEVYGKELKFWAGFAFNNVKGQLYPIIGMSGGGILARGKLGVEPPEGWRDQTFIEYQG